MTALGGPSALPVLGLLRLLLLDEFCCRSFRWHDGRGDFFDEGSLRFSDDDFGSTDFQ